MVFYFSAEGNTKYAAVRTASVLNDMLVPVLNFDDSINICKGGDFVLVTPVYSGGLPQPVMDFLKNTKIKMHDSVRTILIVTYGYNCGAVGVIADKALKKACKREFDAKFSVKMPDVFTLMSDLSDSEKVAETNRKADEKLDEIMEMLEQKTAGDFIEDKMPDAFSLVYPTKYKKVCKTSHLSVGDECIGCGLCSKRCPTHSIKMENGKPVWIDDSCAMCLSCLHHCPSFAIDYDGKSKEHGQYTNPNVGI